jgi:hypothetical protein
MQVCENYKRACAFKRAHVCKCVKTTSVDVLLSVHMYASVCRYKRDVDSICVYVTCLRREDNLRALLHVCFFFCLIVFDSHLGMHACVHAHVYALVYMCVYTHACMRVLTYLQSHTEPTTHILKDTHTALVSHSAQNRHRLHATHTCLIHQLSCTTNSHLILPALDVAPQVHKLRVPPARLVSQLHKLAAHLVHVTPQRLRVRFLTS